MNRKELFNNLIACCLIITSGNKLFENYFVIGMVTNISNYECEIITFRMIKSDFFLENRLKIF